MLLVLIVFFMPGGIVYGFRLLRSKFLLIVPRLPRPRPVPARQRDEAPVA